MKNLRYVKASGNEVSNILTDLGNLRIAVFYEFPYLYEGNLEYEKEYLKIYVNTPDSLVFAIYDNDQMIGATTAIPLKHETEEIIKPFIDSGQDIENIFYFGESILLPQYRGLGLGHRFFDEREQHVSSFGNYHTTTFCAVNRHNNHPLKPTDYRTNDANSG
jgi:GNAT superfamily N-acetyltransferase